MQVLSSLPSGVKKRRRCGLRFSSRKQLRRARMGKKGASMLEVVVGDTARVLSFNLDENMSEGCLETIQEQPTIPSYVSEQMHNDSDNECLDSRDKEQSRRVLEVSVCLYVFT